MNRKKIVQALILVNVAVAIAAFQFLPRNTGYGYSWTSEFQRQIKHLWYSTPWVPIFWTLCVSVLISIAIYRLLEGVRGAMPPEHSSRLSKHNS